MARASPTSSDSSERLPHGMSKHVSSHVRIHPGRGDCRLVRANCRPHAAIVFRTSSGSTSSASLGAVLRDRCPRSRRNRPAPHFFFFFFFFAGWQPLLTQQESRASVHAFESRGCGSAPPRRLGSVSAAQGQRFSRRASGASPTGAQPCARPTGRAPRPAVVGGARRGRYGPGEGVGDAGVPSFSACRARGAYTRAPSRGARPAHRGGLGDADRLRPTRGSSLGTVRPTTARERQAQHKGPCPPEAHPLSWPGDGADAGVPPSPPGKRDEGGCGGPPEGGASPPYHGLGALEREGHDHLRQHRPRCAGAAGQAQFVPIQWMSTSGWLCGVARSSGGSVDLGDYTLSEIHNRPQAVCIPDERLAIWNARFHRAVSACRIGVRWSVGTWTAGGSS